MIRGAHSLPSAARSRAACRRRALSAGAPVRFPAIALVLATLAGCTDGRAVFDGARFLNAFRQAEGEASPDAEHQEAAALARAAKEAAAGLSEYTARFEKQERLAGRLRPLEEIDVAIREEPFSVRMTWVGRVDRGKDVLYVEGQNDDRLRVRTGHVPVPATLNLNPEGALAMEGNRHPITRMGLCTLARGLFLYRGESQRADAESFRGLGSLDLDGRTIRVIGRRGTSDPGDVLLFGIDEETRLVVLAARYGPPVPSPFAPASTSGPDAAAQAPQLVEFYCYRRLNLHPATDPAVFDFGALSK